MGALWCSLKQNKKINNKINFREFDFGDLILGNLVFRDLFFARRKLFGACKCLFFRKAALALQDGARLC